MSERPDVTAEDALQVAQRALSKANENERLEARIDELEEKVTSMQLRLSEISEERPYDGLTLDEKIGMVREHAFERATDGHGKTALDYDDIMWGVFDGQPSADHCYKLMRLAKDAPGFDLKDPDGGNRKLTVDAEAAKRGLAFSSANKTSQEGTQL